MTGPVLRFKRYLLASLIALVVQLGTVQPYAQMRTVTVQGGEQLGAIAQRYLVPPATQHWREIAKLNQLQPPYVLRIGQVLKLPDHLLAAQAVPVLIEQVIGEVWLVKEPGQQKLLAKAGDSLAEGDQIKTQSNASAQLRLADESQIVLAPVSDLRVDEHRYALGRKLPDTPSGTKGFAGLLRLLQGSIETKATSASDRAKPLRIQTPTSVVGVRGTAYRVTHDVPGTDDKAAGQPQSTRVEVTQGLVSAALDERRQSDIKTGYGVLMDTALTQAPQPVALLEAPLLDQWAVKYERPVISLDGLSSKVNGRDIAAYRVQVTPEGRENNQIVFDKRYAANDSIRIAGLPDGVWQLRARAIDAQGIEGYNSAKSIQLKARPEPPVIQGPPKEAKHAQGATVVLTWAEYASSAEYLIELTDPAGERIEKIQSLPKLELAGLQPGRYQWRVATQIKNNAVVDRGPWGDMHAFSVIAQPVPPKAEMDGQARGVLHLRWSDQKAASYEIERAREKAALGEAIKTSNYISLKNEIGLVNLDSGVHFLRYRAIEADGFKGGWSDAMKIDIPPDWQHLLIYLGGGSKQWP